ncbi:RpiB/LacA/LacB family sugar-phosphate isomerase [Photobacterium sp. DNB23_23_1]|uniref:RpiB/LacA/LacB family sugar-phosphate isomerase n=1 Tax=Photobacterium pectinilyticum TaxID=2906793 RepID=A0ABT1N2T3_9GAMM|nr:RpiB/LacA/LacB family sugar-phosphate isomerase [Photobacterium sp. ZSDE20]MCQ1059053.1 RpiB/LacA/LacB family sugar-phosphate isomerase [Photobacterium sp. ZSDE20]MDD1824204.1 RpiB/LacA/LacB family sugar-phosphate isomerase [Photobacterium sp. ZSDE20]
MKIAIGCDDAATELKTIITQHLESLQIDVTDYNEGHEASEPYADIAARVALAVRDGDPERGIILCGTGIGVCIMANKISGIRAALCHDTFSAERAQLSNNAQIITMGSRVIGPELAKRIVSTWLSCEFVDGPSTHKVNRIDELERENAVNLTEKA